MSPPKNTFDEMICDPIRCNATAAEHLAFDFGAWPTLAIIACSLVAGFKLSRSNLLLPILALAVAGSMFIYQHDKLVLYYMARDNYEEELASRHGDGQLSAEIRKRRARWAEDTASWKSMTSWAWLELSILPFGVGLIGGVIERRRKARAKVGSKA